MPRHSALFRLKLRGDVYQARFTRAGKEHRWSCETGERGAAEQKAKELVRGHDAGELACDICNAKARGGSLPDLADEWLKVIAKTHPARYGRRAMTDLEQYIEKKFTDPREITSVAWEAWKVELHTTAQKRRERLTWGSIANLANTVRAFLRWCAAEGHTDSMPEIKNPTDKQLAQDRAYLWPLDEDEQGRFLWALAIEGEGRALRVYLTLFETWMRKGALEAMTPRWIDFRREQIRIPAAYTKHGKHDVEIDLTPKAAAAIREEMGETVALDRPVFGTFEYRALFPRMADLAGIDLKGLTAHHVTRRTAATLAGDKPGASLAAIKSQGGWRSSSMADRYMTSSVKAARKVTR